MRMATGTRGRCTAACVRSSASTTSTHSLRAATNGLVRAHDGGGSRGCCWRPRSARMAAECWPSAGTGPRRLGPGRTGGAGTSSGRPRSEAKATVRSCGCATRPATGLTSPKATPAASRRAVRASASSAAQAAPTAASSAGRCASRAPALANRASSAASPSAPHSAAHSRSFCTDSTTSRPSRVANAPYGAIDGWLSPTRAGGDPV
mmetsp:Transcript_16043/g.51183  ORF Transcript_16043/g.51183 Transcript_16043/m.51183 type:complete len:206 (-) Transcript_16043:824-1441(-)